MEMFSRFHQMFSKFSLSHRMSSPFSLALYGGFYMVYSVCVYMFFLDIITIFCRDAPDRDGPLPYALH